MPCPAVPSLLLRLWMLAAAAVCAACTTVQVHPAGDATVRITRHLGLLQMELAPGARGLLVVRSRGLGLGRTVSGSTLGWWQETLAATGPQPGCHVVLWVDDSEQLSRVQSLLARSGLSLDRVCVVDGGNQP